MIWLLKNIKLLSIAALVLTASHTATWFVSGYVSKKSTETKQENTQLKHEVKVRRQHEEVDKKIPYSADRARKLDFLRESALSD